MKIIIAGGGKIGSTVAEMLSGEGHDITVIDREPAVITTISNKLDVICMEGSAANPETLREAGAAEADLLLAATQKDEINMICGIAARRLGTRQVIARIRDPEYLTQTEFLRETLGLSVIVNPEYECAKEISRVLRFPSAVRVDTFSQGSMEIIEYRVPEGGRLDGVVLRELPRRFGARVLVCVVEREGEALIPNGDFALRAGDKLSVSGESRELRRFFEALGQYRRPVRSVMIMGGGRSAVYLARLLQESGIATTILERSRERCDALCDLLPETNILCGDATRSDVLAEEGIAGTDAFVALTGDDEDNIITSLYAMRCRVPKVVTKVNRANLAEMAEGFGVDCVVSPKELVAQQLVRFVRAMGDSVGSSMETLHRLADGRAEAMEFKVGEGAACVGVPLRELKLKKDVLISAVIRGGESMIPGGSTVILPGDHAVVVARAGRLKTLDEAMEERA